LSLAESESIVHITYMESENRGIAKMLNVMLNLREAEKFFQKLCNFTDYGMEIEWPMFLALTGEKQQYSKREIAEYAGYDV